MKREPKSIHSTEIKIVGRPGGKKGSLSLNSGNFYYTRSGAKSPTLSFTYQQLLDLLERQVEYAAIDATKLKLPSQQSGDFTLEVSEIEIDDSQFGLFSSKSSLRKLDDRRVDAGCYQFTPDMASGRQTKKYQWVAWVSVQAALWIVHRYIEKFLVGKKFTDATSKDVVVSKREMHRILLSMQKRVAP